MHHELWREPMLIVLMLIPLFVAAAIAGQREGPPGLFKDLTDEIAGKALFVHGKQLFIDDYLLEELTGGTIMAIPSRMRSVWRPCVLTASSRSKAKQRGPSRRACWC